MPHVALWVVTLLRVLLIPPFLYLASSAQAMARTDGDVEPTRLAALVVLWVMGTSDLVDGWMARRFDLATQIGAVVDAIADKVVQVTLVAFFTVSVGPAFSALPFWFLVAVFGRDLALLVGLIMLRARYGPIRVRHRPHGRAASVLVFLVLAGAAYRAPETVLLPIVAVATIVSLTSATLYALDGIAQGRALAG